MKRVVVFGGEGFVGKAVVETLKKNKFDVYIAGRKEPHKGYLQASITNKVQIEKRLKRNDIVINLVGLSPLKKPKGITYKQVHVEGVKNLIEICKKKNCPLIHMAALGANKKAPTEYLRTKGEAIELIKKSKLNATIICPSIIYDSDSEIIKLFDKFAWTRSFPNIKAQMQPIHREDIAKLFLLATQEKIKEQIIEVGGPENISFFKMAKLYYNKKGKACIPIPLFIIKPGIAFAALFTLFGTTWDNLKLLNLNNTTNKKQTYIKCKKYSDWVKNLNTSFS